MADSEQMDIWEIYTVEPSNDDFGVFTNGHPVRIYDTRIEAEWLARELNLAHYSGRAGALRFVTSEK